MLRKNRHVSRITGKMKIELKDETRKKAGTGEIEKDGNAKL